MELNIAQCELKMKQLLEKFLAPSYPAKLDSYLDKLLVHLAYLDEAGVNSTLVSTHPIFTEWITRTVPKWNTEGTIPPTKIVAITLYLLTLLSKNEERFTLLNDNNVYFDLVNILKAKQIDVAPSVKLTYIKLISSFFKHRSGIELIIISNFWEDIFTMSLTPQPLPAIFIESHKFMAKLLECTIDYNEFFCNEIVSQIMLLLGENISIAIEACDDDSVNCQIQNRNLSNSLQLVGNILEYFLEGTLFGIRDFRIPLIFLQHFNFEKRIFDFMLISQDKHFIFDMGKIVFLMQFLELYMKVTNNIIDPENLQISINKIMHNFTEHIAKGNFENVMKFCDFGQFYWNLMGYKIPHFGSEDGNESINLAKELVALGSLPNFLLIRKYCYSTITQLENVLEDDFRNFFMGRLMGMMSEKVLRLAYIWRDFLLDQPNLFEICFLCLVSFKKSRKYFPKDRAVVIFQLLLYNLQDFLGVMEESPEKFDIFTRETGYFSNLFEVLAICIEEFHVKWTDSVEVIDVMAVTTDFLMVPTWPNQVVVKALKLVDISINKYMSPNLALLVDSVNDSTMLRLGPLLQIKLYSEAPEVKNACLEVIYTISRMTNNKFPSLQKVLMDSELPTLVVKMSTCDGESFVRATAIKCLQEMIQVEEIWNNILKAEDLPLKMRDILLNETEGIVRVEAATFMCIAYENQQFQPETLDTIYETMIYSSTTDLHWEVKVRALGFWDKVIKNHLQNQGMIDGSFPNVTFSKEHRKIVTLTDAEIRKRLQKVLNQLSSIGCLGVLVSAIKDDCDMEVSKTAVKITQSLVDLFKKYNVYGDLGAPTSPLPVENGVSSSVSMSSGISVDESMDSPNNFFNSDFTDEIINEIVNSKDVSLLKNVYSPSDYGSVVNYDFQVRKIISPNEFLQFTQQDLNNVIAEKKNWLNGIEDLGSLLDDMLKTYDDDVNNMDCY